MDNKGIDSVDLSTLNVVLDIPLIEKTGRGVPLSLHLTHNNNLWQIGGYAINAGWQDPVQHLTGYVTYLFGPQVKIPCGSSPISGPYHFLLTDPMGIAHTFVNIIAVGCSRNPTYVPVFASYADDGSGLYLDTNSAECGFVSSTGLVKMTNPNGTWSCINALRQTTDNGHLTSSLPAGSFTDSNGNQISIQNSWLNSANWTQTSSVTDTLGATLPVQGSVFMPGLINTGTYTSPVYATPTPTTISYTDSNGTQQSISINYTDYFISPNFGWCSNAFNPQSYHPSPDIPLISSIVFPNGKSYSFQYETFTGSDGSSSLPATTGRLSSITLPTGGTISYAYSGGQNGVDCYPYNYTGTNGGDLGTDGLTRTTDDGTWTYTRVVTALGFTQTSPSTTAVNIPSQVVTTSVDPAGETAVYTFATTSIGGSESYPPSPNIYWETTRKIYAGAATGTPLLYQQVCYQGTAQPCSAQTNIGLAAGQSGTYPVSVQVDRYTSLNGQASSKTTDIYPTIFIPTPSEEDVYDSGGHLLKTTLTSFLSINGLISSKPTKVVVKDGTGIVVAQSSYGYDETDVTPTSGVVSHVAAAGQRANLTSASNWLNTSSTWLKSVYTNDDTGNRLTEQDPNTVAAGSSAYTNQYIYTDSWYSNGSLCGSNVTNAFVTQTIDALGHSSKSAYDACTGLIRQTQDPNDLAASRSGTITSYDKMNNVVSTAYPDGGSTSVNYGNYANPFTVTTTTGASPNPSLVNKTISDGYGRPIRTQLTSDPSGIDSTDTTYDSLGRVYTVSNPYRASDTVYVTTNTYDALGRPLTVTSQDGTSQKKWSYSGYVTTFTDEAQNQWQRTTDILGRLVRVLEPNGTATSPSMETDYSYDLLNNLSSVTQWGGANGSSGSRTRSSKYDSLSRLIQAFNPESGWICYGTTPSNVAPNGSNCTEGYDANGNLTTKIDARAITTAFTYDALDRLIQKSYNSDGPVLFGYDVATVTFDPIPTNAALKAVVSLTNPIGRLSWSCREPATQNACITQEALGYDAMGRVVHRWSSTPAYVSSAARVYGQSFVYDKAGNRTSMNNGASRTFQYTYDGAGHLATALHTTNLTVNGVSTPTATQMIGSATYFPSEQMKTVSTNSGSATLTGTWGVDQRLRVNSYVHQSTANLGNTNYGYSLTYTTNGNVQTDAETAYAPGVGAMNWSWAFNYDTLNRLKNAKSAGAILYGCAETYDAFGNRLSQAPYGGTGYSCTSATNGVSTNNRMNGANYSYDASGDLLSDGTRTMTYDAEGRIASYTPNGGATTSYTYDADGQRVSKTVGGVETDYVRDTDDSLLTTFVNGSFYGLPQELWVGGKHFGTVTVPVGNATQSQAISLTNWLGSEAARADVSTGIPTSAYLSQPFGDGQTTLFGTDTDDVHLTGKERDTESGNDYLGARYYSSNTARFMSPDWSSSPDPVPFADFQNPQSLNLYAYAEDNPVSGIDADGHSDCVAQHVLSIVRGVEDGSETTSATCNAFLSPGINLGNAMKQGLVHAQQAAEQATQQAASSFLDYLTANRRPGCVGAMTGAGATVGASAGALGGLAGGPAAPVTVSSGAAGGFVIGGVVGWANGMSLCRTGTSSGGGSGGGGGQKKWNITNPADKKVIRGRTYLKDANTGSWWSRDTAGHGGSAWKVYREESGGFRWIADADEKGDFIKDKWKSPDGMFVKW